MEQSTTTPPARHFTGQASLAGLGVLLRQRDVFAPIRARVHSAQKTVRHAPLDKLYDGFIAILTGAHGLVEINTRLRSDPALQAAMGRTGCAEQSVVQQTLDACTPETVAQMEDALDEIYRQHGAGYRHDYAQSWQLLDADISGAPCGPKAACATKGYFAKQRNRRGRQIGRVLASHYSEVVVDRLFPGTTQLAAALPGLIAAAERTLDLDGDPAKRARTIVRIDGGGGSVADINGLLERGGHQWAAGARLCRPRQGLLPGPCPDAGRHRHGLDRRPARAGPTGGLGDQGADGLRASCPPPRRARAQDERPVGHRCPGLHLAPRRRDHPDAPAHRPRGRSHRRAPRLRLLL
ncbi:MAG: hypothetical protein M3Y74_14310 [Chloroflexota bacterium]|nr:hypothetical protein [Chloroflexota bacterium]